MLLIILLIMLFGSLITTAWYLYSDPKRTLFILLINMGIAAIYTFYAWVAGDQPGRDWYWRTTWEDNAFWIGVMHFVIYSFYMLGKLLWDLTSLNKKDQLEN